MSKIRKVSKNNPLKQEPLNWDDPLPDDILEKWRAWNKELASINKKSVPRCVRDLNPITDTEFTLQVFCDASEAAFGAVCYLRMERKKDIDTRLIFAKSRVAPVKLLTIPRLELQASVLAKDGKHNNTRNALAYSRCQILDGLRNRHPMVQFDPLPLFVFCQGSNQLNPRGLRRRAMELNSRNHKSSG